jgi:hypothetical protein
METLTVDHLVNESRRQTDLTDFGSDRFLEPLRILVKAINTEAELTPSGFAAQRARLINALANRLRKQALLQAHPEIRDVPAEVAFAIVSLPRTGSTMLQRLLGASPSLTATRWWEAIFPLPMAGEGRTGNQIRIAHASALIQQITNAAGNLHTIHKMDPHAHDEDLLIVEQSFVSTMPEAMMYVPSYGEYVLHADATWVYDELHEYLQILQWQTPGRETRRWVLKSPNHLLHVPVILDRFPTAVIIMTHRDITQVMGSWYSMAESLRRADSSANRTLDNVAHWNRRWRAGLNAMASARQTDPDRFFDVQYSDLLDDPMAVAAAVHARGLLPFGHADRTALRAWLDANRRDDRPSHVYSLEEFGMNADQVRALFPEE